MMEHMGDCDLEHVDYEAELRAIMEALAESVVEASDEDLLQEISEEGRNAGAIANRVRTVLKRAATDHRRLFDRAPRPQSNRLLLEAESNIVPAVELAFATKSVRNLCESKVQADRHLGVAVAERLRRRLSDLRAATSVKDLVAGKPRELARRPQSLFAVQLGGGARLVFRSNHIVTPVLASGNADWSQVTRVKILRIEQGDD